MNPLPSPTAQPVPCACLQSVEPLPQRHRGWVAGGFCNTVATREVGSRLRPILGGLGPMDPDWSLTGSELLDGIIGAICVFALPVPSYSLSFCNDR